MNSIHKGTCSSMSHFLSRLRLKLNGNKFTTATVITPVPTQLLHASLHTNHLTTMSLPASQTKIKVRQPFTVNLFPLKRKNVHFKLFHQDKRNAILFHCLFAVPSFPAHTSIVSRRYHFRRQESAFPSSNVAHFHVTRHQSSTNSSNESGRQVLNLAQEILAETERLDVMAGSIPRSQVEKLIEELQTLGFDNQPIKTLLSGKLWLLRQIESTLTLCRLLLDHGSTPHLICQVFDRIPLENQKDIRVVPDKINEMMLFFRSFGFSEKEMFSLLNKDASVLFMEQSSIKKSIEMVKSYFPFALTKKVVCASPNVLRDDWQLTHDKFNYVVFMMGYNQSDIVGSRMFSHSLHHIQDRHLFLQRAGVFQVVNKKLHPSLNVNPPLATVVDAKVSFFVNLVEGVTVQDYQVFKKMRKIEREKGKLGEDDDDDDSDSDDDEDDVVEDYGDSTKSKMDSRFRGEKT